mgnify:CR=1 FL=1
MMSPKLPEPVTRRTLMEQSLASGATDATPIPLVAMNPEDSVP